MACTAIRSSTAYVGDHVSEVPETLLLCVDSKTAGFYRGSDVVTLSERDKPHDNAASIPVSRH